MFLTTIFDQIHQKVESHTGHRVVGTSLVVTFILALACIELNREGLLPSTLSRSLPTSHLAAISLAFTLLLVFEVVSLTLTLAKSVSTSVGKQFEILALILLRNVFKELSLLSEPINWPEVEQIGIPIISQSLGALLLFTILGCYYRLQSPHPITKLETEKTSFIQSKKIIALGLLITFIAILAKNLLAMMADGKIHSPFEAFYTVLIFTDILIVLISIRYSSSFHVSFRNSAFAVATVLIRIALIAPPLQASILGVGTALYALGITFAYKHFAPDMGREKL